MTLRAGFGTATITPDVPVMLAGFGGRTEPARAVHDSLEARALHISDGESAACLIVCDLLGMSAEYADPVRAAVSDALSLPRAAVLTACIHTHSGPNAIEGGERLGWPSPAGYGDLLVERCLRAARAAADTAEPAEAFAAVAPLPAGLSMNRRGLPYDPRFAVLDLRRPDGSRVGTVANVGIHPVALGEPWLEVSSDWVGPFREALESAGGGTAMLLSGALGDVNPVEHHSDVETHLAEAAEEARALGAGVAAAVAAALSSASPVSGTLRTASRSLKVPAGGTPLTALLGIAEANVELVEWAIGDVHLVAVPGEPFHALGRSIAEARGGFTLIAGLAPAWNGYLPAPYGEGYEETVSLGAAAVEEISHALMAEPFERSP